MSPCGWFLRFGSSWEYGVETAKHVLLMRRGGSTWNPLAMEKLPWLQSDWRRLSCVTHDWMGDEVCACYDFTVSSVSVTVGGFLSLFRDPGQIQECQRTDFCWVITVAGPIWIQANSTFRAFSVNSTKYPLRVGSQDMTENNIDQQMKGKKWLKSQWATFRRTLSLVYRQSSVTQDIRVRSPTKVIRNQSRWESCENKAHINPSFSSFNSQPFFCRKGKTKKQKPSE